MTAFELAGKLKLDSSEFSSSLNNEESKFKKFGNKLENAAKKTAKMAAAGMATVGAGAVMFTKSSIQEGLDFDKAMSQVAATLGKSTDEVQDLSKFAREMGSKTAFSATEAAEALNYMALAGYDSEKSMRMLPTVLNLAAAGNIDLAKASDMVTDAQSALGLSIEETEQLVDKMAKTSSKTNTSVEQLGEAYLTVGGTAKMMSSGSIDATTELSMALGVLADNGIKGSEGGTMLRNVLLSLSAPTDKAKEALDGLGISVYDAEGNMRDLPDILADINEATKGMTQAQRTDFLNTVFNKRDLKAIEALLGTDMDRWKELYDEIGDAEGAAEKMAATQLDNLEGDLTIFKSALSEAKISLSDKLAPTLRWVVQRATTYVSRLTQAFNENGLAGAVEEAKTIIKELITESLGIASDSTWLDIGKAVAGKLKEGLKTKLGESKVKLANLLGLTDESGNAIDDPSDVSWVNVAKAAFNKLKEKFKGAVGSTKVKLANWLGLTDDSGNAVDDPSDTSWSNIAEGIKTKLQDGFKKLKVGIADLLGITPEDVEGEASWSDIGKRIIEKMTEYFSHKGDFLKKLILGDEFTDESTWMDVGKKISGWLTEALGEGGLINSILGEGSERLTAIISFAGDLLTGIATWMSQNSSELTTMLTTLINAAAKAISTSAGPIINALGAVLGSEDLWRSIISGLANVGEALLDAILGKDLTNGIRRFFGVEIPGEVSDKNKDNLKAGFVAAVDEYIDAGDDTGKQKTAAANWHDLVRQTLNASKVDPSLYNEIMDKLDFDTLIEAFKTDNLDDFWAAFDNIVREINGGKSDVDELGDSSTDTSGDVTDLGNAANQAADELRKVHSPSSQGKIPGSFAKGELSVPYDNYIANLHRGEMVLTASQARDYRGNNGSSNFDVSSFLSSLTDTVKSAMESATLKTYLNGKDITAEVNRNNTNDLKSRRYRA